MIIFFTYSNDILFTLLLILFSNISFAPLPTRMTSEIHCVFVHGLNAYIPSENDQDVYFYTSENIHTLDTNVTDYWGDVVKTWTQEGESRCSTYAFTLLNTVEYAYNYEGDAKAVCKALSNNNVQPKRTKVFMHSMGNLIFYSAIAQNYCQIDKANTTVYSLAGPFNGAPVVEPLNEVCEAIQEAAESYFVQKCRSIIGSVFSFFESKLSIDLHSVGYALGSMFPDELEKLHLIENICSDGKASPGINSCYKVHDPKLIEAANTYSSGALCGTSPDGDLLYDALRFLTKWYSVRTMTWDECDGVVPTASCTVNNPRKYAMSNDDNFLTVPFNHTDLKGVENHEFITDWLINRK